MPQEIPPISILTDALTGVHLTPQQERALQGIARMAPPVDLAVLADLLRSLRARVRMGAALLQELPPEVQWRTQDSGEWDQHVTGAIVQAQCWRQPNPDGLLTIIPNLDGGPRIMPTVIRAESVQASCAPVAAYLQRQADAQPVEVEPYRGASPILRVQGARTGEVEVTPTGAWMAAWRKGTTVHLLRTAGCGEPITSTVCGRSIRAGLTLPLALATAKAAVHCPRCFPATGADAA